LGERLAGRAADEEVDVSMPGSVSWVEQLREISMIRNLGMVVREHR